MADEQKSVHRLSVLVLFILGLLNISDAQITLDNLAETFGSLFGGGDDCQYVCPDGSHPKKNPNHIPSSNGCGALGLQLDTSQLPDMTKCCHKHDKCYDTCNSERDMCDFEFKECLEELCKMQKKKMSKSEYKNCNGAMNLMYAGTMALGCKPYKDAQASACICPGRKNREL